MKTKTTRKSLLIALIVSISTLVCLCIWFYHNAMVRRTMFVTDGLRWIPINTNSEITERITRRNTSGITDGIPITTNSLITTSFPTIALDIVEYEGEIWSERKQFRGNHGNCPNMYDYRENGVETDKACGCNATKEWTDAEIKALHTCCRDITMTVFKAFDAEMRKHQVLYQFDGGAVMGWLRNGKFIPHDKDLDFTVKYHDWKSKAFKEVLDALVEKHDLCIRHVESFKLKMCLKGLCMDIWPNIIQKGLVYQNFYAWEIQPVENLYPERTVVLEGVETYFPNKPKEYCDVMFGKGAWEKPLYKCEENGICNRI